MFGEEGAGFAISIVVHIVLLAVLAIPLVHSAVESVKFTTLLPDVEDAAVVLSPDLDMQISLPEAAPGADVLEMTAISPDSEIPTVDLKIDPQQKTQLDGQAAGTGSDAGALGGGRMPQPANAVIAGNFSIWSVPIMGRLNNEPILGTAGDFPNRYQDYFIVIQMNVPPGRDHYRLSDLSGQVVGTDLYTQPIPARAYMQSADGRIVRANPWRDLKLQNGVVQLFIHVPGANAFVQDTINIHSKMLNEEQELVLTFKPSFAADSPK